MLYGLKMKSGYQESKQIDYLFLLSLIIQGLQFVNSECTTVNIDGFRNSSLTGHYVYENDCNGKYLFQSGSHNSQYLYFHDNTGHWVISPRKCGSDAQQDAYANISVSVDDFECVHGTWYEYNTNGGGWEPQEDILVDCQDGCDDLVIEGFERTLNGEYEEEDRPCNDHVLYEHSDDDYYLSYDTGYWIISERRCNAYAHSGVFARVQDNAKYAHCIRADWTELIDEESNTWEERSNVQIQCQLEAETGTSESGGFSWLTVGLICSGGTILFSLVAYAASTISKKRRQANAARASRSHLSSNHQNTGTSATAESTTFPSGDEHNLDFDSQYLPPAYTNQVSTETSPTSPQYSLNQPGLNEQFPNPPSYEEAVASQPPIPSYVDAVKDGQVGCAQQEQVEHNVEPSAPPQEEHL